MKGSLIIVGFFLVGILFGHLDAVPASVSEIDLTTYALWMLLFCVGITLGSDPNTLHRLIGVNPRLVWLPLCTIVGSLGGSAVASLWMSDYSITDCMAVGAGFGYYSLSSIFITQYKGAELGSVALLSNIFREIFTLLGAPLLITFFGKLAPISCGGATTMDTTLPIITRYSGKEFAAIAIFHGVVVDFTVPFLVTFFATR